MVATKEPLVMLKVIQVWNFRETASKVLFEPNSVSY